jgi:hypothetical protein
VNSDDPTDTSEPPNARSSSAGARILARSFYKELRANGYTPSELVAVSSELITLVTLELQRERETAEEPALPASPIAEAWRPGHTKTAA